jgi:hypothetical protein
LLKFKVLIKSFNLLGFGHGLCSLGRDQFIVLKKLVELAVEERQMSRHGLQLVAGVRAFRTLGRIGDQLSQLVHEVPTHVISAVLLM